MNFFLQKTIAIYNILNHLRRNWLVISNPLSCSRLFMERTDAAYSATLRYKKLRFTARKEDMNAVIEVLVGGGYDTMIPYLQSIPHAPVILDCGANIGCFGLRVLGERPDAQIVSVEAAEDTYRILLANQKRNPGKWEVIHSALWNSDGVLALTRSENSVMHTVREAMPGDGATIPARSLSSIKRQFGITRVDILKMDIEGAETSVIPASIDDLSAGMMIIEIHKALGDPRECCAILSKIYPHAFVCPTQLSGPTFPNVVYYLFKEKHPGAGMVSVNLMDHLNSVYDPKMWPTS